MSRSIVKIVQTAARLADFVSQAQQAPILSEGNQHVTIVARLGSGQAGKARDFGSLIRRFESFLPSQKAAADRISIGGFVHLFYGARGSIMKPARIDDNFAVDSLILNCPAIEILKSLRQERNASHRSSAATTV